MLNEAAYAPSSAIRVNDLYHCPLAVSYKNSMLIYAILITTKLKRGCTRSMSMNFDAHFTAGSANEVTHPHFTEAAEKRSDLKYTAAARTPDHPEKLCPSAVMMHKTSGKLATPVGVVENSPPWSTLPQGASHRPTCIAVENFMYLHVPDVSHDMALTSRCYLCRLMRTISE